MKEHIEKVVEGINAKIAHLVQVRQTVLELDSEVKSMEDTKAFHDELVEVHNMNEELVTTARVRVPVAPMPKRTGRPPGRKNGVPAPESKTEKPAKAGSLLVRMAVAVQHLREPFRSADIQEFTKCDWKTASNWITQVLNKGWVRRVGVGEYTRTPEFGGPSFQSASLLNEIHADIESAKPKED